MNNKRTKIFLITTIVATALFTTCIVNAGKMYKWIDAEGNVHYTGTPPPANQEVKEEEIDMLGASNQTLVTRRGGYDYCGDMVLPGPVTDKENLLRNIQGKREYWQQQLEGQEKSLQESLRAALRSRSRYGNSSTDYSKSAIEEIKELKCALDWEAKIREELRSSEDSVQLEYQRAQARYDQSVETAYADCGPQPRSGNTKEALEKYDSWDRCMSRHRRSIENAKRQLQGAERDYQYLR